VAVDFDVVGARFAKIRARPISTRLLVGFHRVPLRLLFPKIRENLFPNKRDTTHKYSKENFRVLIHHLKLCSFENWVGTDQHRYVQLNKNTLILSTPPSLFHGQKGIGRLTWQRILTL
jgi:hypothetical protein